MSALGLGRVKTLHPQSDLAAFLEKPGLFRQS